MSKTCPMCGGVIRKRSSRVCAICKRPILRGHKYQFNGSQIEHLVCAEPTFYVPGQSPITEPLAEQQTLGVTA